MDEWSRMIAYILNDIDHSCSELEFVLSARLPNTQPTYSTAITASAVLPSCSNAAFAVLYSSSKNSLHL